MRPSKMNIVYVVILSLQCGYFKWFVQIDRIHIWIEIKWHHVWPDMLAVSSVTYGHYCKKSLVNVLIMFHACLILVELTQRTEWVNETSKTCMYASRLLVLVVWIILKHGFGSQYEKRIEVHIFGRKSCMLIAFSTYMNLNRT